MKKLTELKNRLSTPKGGQDSQSARGKPPRFNFGPFKKRDSVTGQG